MARSASGIPSGIRAQRPLTLDVSAAPDGADALLAAHRGESRLVALGIAAKRRKQTAS
jgi:hypothetical protein